MARTRKWVDVEYEADRVWDAFRAEAQLDSTQFRTLEELNVYLDTVFANHNMLKRFGLTGQGQIRSEAQYWWEEETGIRVAGEKLEEEKVEEVKAPEVEVVTIETPTGKETRQVPRGREIRVKIPETKAEPITITEYEIPKKTMEAVEVPSVEVPTGEARTEYGTSETARQVEEVSRAIEERTRTPTITQRVSSVVSGVTNAVTSAVNRIRRFFGR